MLPWHTCMLGVPKEACVYDFQSAFQEDAWKHSATVSSRLLRDRSVGLVGHGKEKQQIGQGTETKVVR